MKEEPVWLSGLYIRLSRDDGGEESLSVANQRKILLDFVAHSFPGQCILKEIYIDDGQTGTDYDRPAFQTMLRHVEEGKINCIICKNLSRMFRNYSDQGYFLENYFPLHRTRLIALGDPQVDTYLNPEAVTGLEIPISGLMNDRFACRTSCDIRRTFDAKRRKGEFIGAFAPYGYRKDPKNRNRLLIDPEAASVVRNIFQWYAWGDGSTKQGGMSKEGIARRLNQIGIPSPSAYKQLQGFRYRNPQSHCSDGLWQSRTISAILSNETYTGVMVQGRQKVVSYKVHQRRAVPREEWYRAEGTHEAVIEPELFHLVQEIQSRYIRRPSGQTHTHLFAGLLKCADCSRRMTRKPSGNFVYYVCSTYRRKSKASCSIHSIRLDRLEQAVLAALQRQMDRSGIRTQTVQSLLQTAGGGSGKLETSALIRSALREQRRIQELSADLYEDWKKGELTQAEYHLLKKKFTLQAEQLSQSIQKLRASAQAEPACGCDPVLDGFLKYHKILYLSQGLLVQLIQEILVHETGEITICFRFHAPS